MSSRLQLKHLVTSSAPSVGQVGDEYFNPSTNKLFKRLVINGTTLGYQEVPVLSQVVSITNTTTALSSTTGALTVAGGAGIVGNLYVGGNLVITGSLSGSISLATNISGGTAGQLVYQSGVSTTAFAGPGTAGQVLTSAGTGAPTYVTTTTLYVGRALTADSVSGSVANISGGILGQIPYQLGANSTAFIGTGTAGTILQMGANTATFVTTANIYVSSANSSNNVRGGILGQIPYQSAANTTLFIGTGTAGTILQMGANTATFVATSTIYVNRATISDQVTTILQTGNATYFPTFVDSNNAAATAESFFTTSSFNINAQTGNTTVGGSAGTHKLTVRTAISAPGTDGVSIEAGSTSTALRPWLAAGNYNPAVVLNDSALIFTNGQQGNGNFIIAPWSNTSTGIRLASAGSAFSISMFGNMVAATSTLTGAVQIMGGIGVGAGSVFGGITTVTNTTSATSTVTGAFQVLGGIGIRSNASIGGALVVGAGDTNQMGVRGEIRATNEITAYFSDRRLKENVQIIGDAVTKVLSLHGITYNANDLAASFGYDKTKKLVGVFADEIDAVLPEAVRPAPFDIGENGVSISGQNFKTVQYERIVPLLIEAIKEQQTLINKLEKELQHVKREIESLR